MPARLRLPAAIVTAAVVAEAAVLLLRPRQKLLQPAPVALSDHFSPEEVTRAQDFAGPQRILGFAVMGIELAVLAGLIARPPERLRDEFGRPLLGDAAAGAALSLALTAAPLPLRAMARRRAVDVGLVTQSWGGWAQDLAKATAIGTAMAGTGAALGLELIRRHPRDWWLPASFAVVGLSVAATYAGPVLMDPVFNKFTPLPPGRTRADVLELGRLAGVDLGEVYAVDASRRTTASNAYVNGLGHTKRVVLYDNLLEDFSRDEVRLVVAHELGHVKRRDVPRGLAFLALIAPAALFATQRTAEALVGEGRAGTPAALPALALSIGIMSFGVSSISNQLSRRVERSADQFSLELTGAPEPFISFERRIVLKNVGDPDPPRLLTAIFATHPPTLERIGAAVRFERERGAGVGSVGAGGVGTGGG
jgi:STE24 endopeptidase